MAERPLGDRVIEPVLDIVVPPPSVRCLTPPDSPKALPGARAVAPSASAGENAGYYDGPAPAASHAPGQPSSRSPSPGSLLVDAAQPEEPAERDWDAEYREIRRKHLRDDDSNGNEAKARELVEFEEAFVREAAAAGRRLIQEQFLPIERRTLRKAHVGGIAGGEKYIINGIFFKFALDNCALYSNSIDAAMKVAGHEMKGLQGFSYGALMAGYMPRLRFPLMCMIDWMGYRLLASAMLPISRETLLIGSADAGRTIMDCRGAQDLWVKKTVEECAKWLKLKTHKIENKLNPQDPFNTSLPLDFEVHRKNGEILCVDFARLFPPQGKKDVLVRLFRSEFMKILRYPLSSDTFSPWMAKEEASQCTEETEAARAFLEGKHMSTVGERLDRLWKEQPRLPAPLLVFLMHSSGINMRYLSHLHAVSKNPDLKRIILVEILSRLIKSVARFHIRRSGGTSSLSVIQDVMKSVRQKEENTWQVLLSQATVCFPPKPGVELQLRELATDQVVEDAISRANFVLGIRAETQSDPLWSIRGVSPCSGTVNVQADVQQLFLLAFQQAFNLKARADKTQGTERTALLCAAAAKYFDCLCCNTQNRFALHNISRTLVQLAKGGCEPQVTMVIAREFASLSGLSYDFDLYRFRDLTHFKPKGDPPRGVFVYHDNRPSICDNSFVAQFC